MLPNTRATTGNPSLQYIKVRVMVRRIILISSALFGSIFPIVDSSFGGIAAQLEQAETYTKNEQYEQAEKIYGHILTDYPAIDHASYMQRNLFCISVAVDRQIDSATQEKDL